MTILLKNLIPAESIAGENSKSFLPHIKDDDYIADLGCGNGRFLQFLKNKN